MKFLRKLIKKSNNEIIIKIFLILRYIINKFNIFVFVFSFFQKNYRKKLSIFSYKKLSKNFIQYKDEIYIENCFYGLNNIIKNILDINGPINGVIEHGVYFGNYISENCKLISNHKIITFSQFRANIINETMKSNKKIISVGPYIEYVKGLMTKKERKEIKKNYGRILLVFPSHSIENWNTDYNYDEFIKEIENRARDFDSVFICLYWKDIKDGKDEEYLKKGFNIVTAGHRNDPNFLRRLKDIINVANMTMSNDIGTHIGYCIKLGKPHYLYKQNISINNNNEKEYLNTKRNNSFISIYEKQKNELIENFSSYKKNISYNQKKVVNKYWGCKNISYYN